MKQLVNLIIVTLIVPAFFIKCTNNNSQNDPWKTANSIVEAIGSVSFKDTTYNIIKYGAIADGKRLNTAVINSTIEMCSINGGGTVLVPEGTYLTGAIHLEDNVNLKVEKGATLLFSVNPKDYLPVVKTSWEGIFCYNYSPLIYAYGKKNIALTGEGTVNGMAKPENWWRLKGKTKYGWKEGMESQLDSVGQPLLNQYNKDQTPVEDRQMGKGHYLRPHFIQFYECTNALIEGITVEDSPFWVIHPVLCENLTIRGVTVNSNGPNNDGCDPESCKNVLIENCVFNTGDDCIALKSGRDEDGRAMNRPIENVVIRNCMMKNGHGGVVLGSEISSGCKNIFVENCEMNSPELDRAIRIKTNNNRGGVTENIYIRNLNVGQVKEAIVRINCSYDSREGQGNFIPVVKNIYISNVQSQKAQMALKLEGLEGEKCIKNIHIENCSFNGVKEDNVIKYVESLNMNSVHINDELINESI